MGIQPSQEVTNAIVEDVSFRIRQLTDVRLRAVAIIVHIAKLSDVGSELAVFSTGC